MIFSESEICRKVRVNGGNRQYISILAQLNCCPVSYIENILRNNGFVNKKGNWTFVKSENITYGRKFNFSINESDIFEKRVQIHPDVTITGGVYKKKVTKQKMKKLLSADQCKKIAKEYEETGISYKKLAEFYGVSTWLIGEAVRNFGSNKKSEEKESCSSEVIQESISDIDSIVLPIIKTGSTTLFISLIKTLDTKSLKEILSNIESEVVYKKKELAILNALKVEIKKLLV